MDLERKQILLTNDDGIQSPGLWAAAEALSSLGYVTVVAPRHQSTGAGRSYPLSSDGRIEALSLRIGQQDWSAYAVGGSPAQAVLHGVLEVMPARPDLIVAGINYGENIGNSITISGTVGAVMEAASLGIPGLAVSQQILDGGYLNYSREVDFSGAAYFARYFAELLLAKKLPSEVEMLKVDVPVGATPQTPWRWTRVSRLRFYVPISKRKGSLDEPGEIGFYLDAPADQVEPDSDICALIIDHMVSVSPMSIDLTARVDLHALKY